jgi:WD40 repeat protein
MSQNIFAMTTMTQKHLSWGLFEQNSGKQLVDARLFLYEGTRSTLSPLNAAGVTVSAMAVSPTGDRFAFGTVDTGGNYTINQITATGKANRIPDINAYHTAGSQINKMAFSPDGTLIAFACDGRTVTGDKRLVVRNAVTQVEVFSSTRCQFGAKRLFFTPDGSKLIVTGWGTGSVTVWDTATWTFIEPVSPASWISSTAMSADGSQFAVGYYADDPNPNRLCTIYSTADCSVVRHIEDALPEPNEEAMGLAWSPDGARFVVMFNSSPVALRVYETTGWTITNNILREWYDPEQDETYDNWWFDRIAFTNDSARIICAGGWEPENAGWLVNPAGNPVIDQEPTNVRLTLHAAPNMDPVHGSVNLTVQDLVVFPSTLLSNRIAGTVRDEDNLPAQRLVRVYNRESGALLDEVMSAEDGTFSFAFYRDTEVQRIALDADAAPLFNDKIDRIIPV